MKKRTRKIWSMLLTLSMLVGILLSIGTESVSAKDNTVIEPNEFNYEENGDRTITITAFPQNQENGAVVVPEKIDDYTVTALKKTGVSYSKNVVSLTIPGTVQVIPGIFDDHSLLESVTLKNGIQEIAARAFENDENLSFLSLPASLEKIGESAFEFCYDMTTINLPGNLTSIGSQAFAHTGLTSLTLPDSVQSVGREAFLECRSLTTAKLSSGMTEIPSGMFQRCTNLTTVTIPASITSISGTAFDDCNLTTINYDGTQAEWEALLKKVQSVSSQTYEMMKNATVHFGNGSTSGPSTPGESTSAIPTPVNLTAESTVGGVQIEWGIPLEVGDVRWDYDEFVIVRELSNGTGAEIGRTKGPMEYSYLDKDVEDGETYTYIVCAIKDNKETGALSESVTITYDANPYTTGTIRSASILLGNQDDGEDNYIGVDKLWLTTGAQGMYISLVFDREMPELDNQNLSVTVSGGGQTFQGTGVTFTGQQQVGFNLVLNGGKHLEPNTTYTVTVKDARSNTIAQTNLKSAGKETASWGFTNKDASYNVYDYFPEAIAKKLSKLDASHGEDGLCFGMALAAALWQQGEMPAISGGNSLLNTVSWSDTVSGVGTMEDYIKMCNAMQFAQDYADQTRANMNDYDGLVRALKSGKPVIIGTWISGTEGHAVLAYDYKEENGKFTIYVHDPQCMPYQISTMTLKGSSGNWFGWGYQRRSWKVESNGANDDTMRFSWRVATTGPDDAFDVDSFLVDAGENIKQNVGEDLDNLWENIVGGANVALTPLTGTSLSWLKGSGTVTMKGLSDAVELTDCDISVRAEGANASFTLDDEITAASVSGSGSLALTCTAGDVTVRFNGTAANAVTMTRNGDGVSFSGAETGSVVVTEGNATTSTTTITPGQDVSVSFDGEIDEKPEVPDNELPFGDVHNGDWFYESVLWAYDNGLMTGTSATTFAPNTSTTRAMIVAILNRLEDGPTAEGGNRFNDVHTGDWYADAVNWAASEGIVAGFTDNTFQPNAPITREQMAAILYNYAQWKGLDVSARADLSRYSDQPSEWATEVMQWAVGKGLISGTSATTLDPQGSATRAQVAAILQRFLEG